MQRTREKEKGAFILDLYSVATLKRDEGSETFRDLSQKYATFYLL